MGNIKVIGEHSVDVDLLNGGVCIDLGCRGFVFSTAMRDLGLTVYAFDLEEMDAPEGITYIPMAVTTKTEMTKYVPTVDKQGTYVNTLHGSIEVHSIALNEVYQLMTKPVDILKMDIESSEYSILSDENFKPIPKQVSIEWHNHSAPELHKKYYDKCMCNLLKYYEPVKHAYYDAHGAGQNYWDSLFIRRD